MPLTEIALLLTAVAFCILVATLIPTLLAVKRTATTVGDLAEMVRSELQPTLHELTGVLTELKTVGGGVVEHTDDVKCFMSALGETGVNLSSINRSVGVITKILDTSTIWSTGARVAAKYMLDRYLKKQGGK